MKAFFISFLLTGFIFGQELPDKPEPQPDRRILWLIPAYDVVTKDGPIAPLDAGDKLRLFADNSFDRFTFVTAGFDAAINQGLNNPEGYGQGGEGYAKRYGAAVADKVTSDFFKTFAYPSLFRQDPRYFTMTADGGRNSNARRIRYAISRAFVTRGDNGHAQFNISSVLGNATAAGLTNVWYPPRDRDVETTLARFGTRMGVDMAANIFKEFWHELSGVMKMRH
jgi:hypothetical protein